MGVAQQLLERQLYDIPPRVSGMWDGFLSEIEDNM